MKPKYDMDKIKFSVDPPTFEKAIGLYEGGKIKTFHEEHGGFIATVVGTKPYKVYVSNGRFDEGSCECYLGQNDALCKHMVAVALYAVTGGKLLSEDDKRQTSSPLCSGRVGELNEKELGATKKSITGAVKYIKPYNGPSRIWFSYQNSLSEGCARLSKIVSELPVSTQTAKLLVDTLLRLDNKLSRGGVDDSDGAVGGCIEQTVDVLEEYARIDSSCIEAFKKLEGKETCFSWEEPLVKFTK